MKDNNNSGIWFAGVCIGFFLGAIIGYIDCRNEYKNKEVDPPTPVEKNVIDTLYLTRDNIITRVKYLDSIKYDTIEKIYVLNDTASVELFYKLVSE